ncbi:hypothetical protein GCM10010168_33450 [Actinoplanes ianthinogenes]|uniref:protealysin inhibitor emfourin n=1 Tax=Actinoplanes ianthinogenes TaxID=122358 RepID=UPI0016707E04|nr:protealysin inhibitor emfourin [Actinoplanes ianthinogenes]GGR12986.1 hypothetical protein GCM10010168_33450 [Actinoplanes ianthinogenes]
MRVTLTTHGGMAAALTRRLPPKVLDTADLSPKAEAELRELISAAATAPPAAANPAARDEMTYTVTVDDDGELTTLTASDAAMSAEFSTLLSWLEDQ